MARKNRDFEKIMLIVCEGTASEAQYFGWLRDRYAVPNGVWSKIEVSSNTTLPEDIVIPQKGELNRARKKRNLKFSNPNKRKKSSSDLLKELWEHVYGTDCDSEKYEEISAQPLRYVAQAQCINDYKEGVYDEIWAVFDKDGHTAHDAAFERAKKLSYGKETKIAFSNRSFEQWILLHFEKSNSIFEFSECKTTDEKTKKKAPLECNAEKGCRGERCLVGYIRKNYYPDYEKSNADPALDRLMKALVQLHNSAFENTLWLREQQHLKDENTKTYELNPYSDVDLLVKSILGIGA